MKVTESILKNKELPFVFHWKGDRNMSREDVTRKEDNIYLWGGDFIIGDYKSCVAVVLLNTDYKPPNTVALYGSLKTENIGIEKIVANVISNPNIRFLVLCGEDIRGHRSGESLLALHRNGIDNNHRIIDAPGAIPYIENIDNESICRFQKQIEIINLLGEINHKILDNNINSYLIKNPGSFGKPFIAIRLIPQQRKSVDDTRALHSKIIVSYMGKIKKRL